MLNRYIYTTETTGSYSNRHYETTLMPTIKPNIKDIYIYASSADRLDLLSQKYYGDARHWWIIALANNLGKGSLQIPVGKQIRIPADIIDIEGLYRELQEGR
jgi:hypothetical protein